MKNYFSTLEFIIDPEMEDIPIHVSDKIWKYHIPIINPIQNDYSGISGEFFNV